MDFQDILAQASHNAQKATKLVSNLDQEAHEQRIRRREQYERDLMREREERKRKAPPKVEKKFVIPKKKNPTEDVNPQAIQNFMEKQRRDKMQKDIQRKKERDQLIGLRLQANQGKANKKIASHFGKSAIELQQRYASNSHMEMELLKRQQREQEELEKMSSAVRDSIEKAKKERATVLARSQSLNNGKSKEKTRVGNVKAGGFADVTSKQEAVLTKRKAEDFTTFASNREKQKKPRPTPQSGGAPALDFKTLMAQAQQNKDVKSVAAKTEQIIRTGQAANAPSNSREVMKRAMAEQRNKPIQPAPQPTKTQKPVIQSSNGSNRQSSGSSQSQQMSSRNGTVGSSSSSALKRSQKVENPYALSDRHVLGPPPQQQQQIHRPAERRPIGNRGDRPLPPIPQTAPRPGQRLLPGDLRYKAMQASSSSKQLPASSSQTTPKLSSSSSNNKKPLTNGSSMSQKDKRPADSRSQFPDRHSSFKRPLSPPRQQSSSSRHDRPYPSSSQTTSSQMSREPEKRPHDSRPRSNPAMFGKRPTNSSYISGYNYSDESNEDRDDYEEEEDYDSEMDDFIDDSAVEDLEKADFEESLRAINRNYDKRKWMVREKMINERQMDARYHEIEAEERKSAKAGLLEDYREAIRGSKGLA